MNTTSLFIHHRTDAVTKDHFERLKRFSRGSVVAISSSEPLPGGFSIDDCSSSLWRDVVNTFPHLRAKATDLLLIDWFRNRRLDSDRYAIFEWDTLVNVEVDGWFSDVARYPLAAPSIRLFHREPDWFRRHWKSLPQTIAPFATGIVPFSCVLVSHKALERTSTAYNEYLPSLPDATGELRFPTIAAICGLSPVAIPNSHTVTWKPFMPLGLAETIYHPVKRKFQEPTPWMQPAEITAFESLLKPDYHVLEYGSGRSTFWLSDRVAKVTSIEHDAAWLRASSPYPSNVELRYAPPEWPSEALEPAQPGQFDEYVKSADDLSPDLVLVDGRSRVDVCNRWATKTPTLLHDAHRPRYRELSKRILAGSLAIVEASFDTPRSKGVRQ
jgi:hypothetical protein